MRRGARKFKRVGSGAVHWEESNVCRNHVRPEPLCTDRPSDLSRDLGELAHCGGAPVSRAKRVFQSVSSGYVLLAATALYNLGSVPLALAYLTTEEFGLWALISQVTGYLALIDLGMSSSVGRALFDFKDDAASGDYGAVIQTGFLVLVMQGALLLVVGVGLTPLLVHGLKIPADLGGEFARLLWWQCLITAGGFATRIFGCLLVAQHRYDIVNYVQAAVSGANYVLLWWFLGLGWKLDSLPASNAICLGVTSGALIAACGVLRVYPPRGRWGRPSWARLRELLAFGKDVFLVTLGAQLILASQTLIVTRALGLQAVGVWTVCTKTFTLVSQFVWRIHDFSGSVFAEMIVRQERERLHDRFRGIVMLTASVAVVAAVVFAVTNAPFVAVWTHGRVAWDGLNNGLLGVWLVIVSVLRCHSGLVLLTKRVGFLRYAYFVEGLVFFAAGNLLARTGGVPAMLVISIGCSLVFTWAYGVGRSQRYFGIGWGEVAWGWMIPMGKVALGLVPFAVLVWVAGRGWPDAWRFAVNATLVGGLGAFLVARVGIPRSLQQEIVRRLPPRIKPVLKHLFAVADLDRQEPRPDRPQ